MIVKSFNLFQVLINCTDSDYEKELVNLKEEIQHLTKLENIDFNNSKIERKGTSLWWFNINDNCNIRIEAEVRDTMSYILK